MKYKTIFNSIKDFLVRLTDVLVPVVSVALLIDNDNNNSSNDLGIQEHLDTNTE